MCEQFEFLREALYRLYNAFDEHLQNRVRPSEALAVVLAELPQVVVLLLQNRLGCIALLLVSEVLVGLVLGHGDGGSLLQVAPLLRQDVVLVLDNEVNTTAEVLVELVELGAKVFADLEPLLQELLAADVLGIVVVVALVLV